VRIPRGPDWDRVRKTLQAVDTVHGDGDVPPLPVVRTRSALEAGVYEPTGAGAPRQLGVSRRAPDPHITFVHEIGHFLDHQALGGPGRYATADQRIGAVLQVLEDSAALRAIRDLRGRKRALVEIRGRRRALPVNPAIVEYLASPQEAFARAYAQYIAIVSQDADLLRELRARRSDETGGKLYHQQWDDDDFRPIAAALDALFRTKGWRR
jgi:hypothetical protein